ncbi:MAG TPA: DUF1850 domain-containing protein [Thiolinea sp.]|nr:DUF1850 domain-containing protein [Thiolinea sp.]
MSLCVVTAGKTLTLAVSLFTLSWTHSVEKTGWQEDWQVSKAGLQLLQARVKGSGAGMEPGDGAVLRDGWWEWQPQLPPQSGLLLAASGATGQGWSLCSSGHECLALAVMPGEPVSLSFCENQAVKPAL